MVLRASPDAKNIYAKYTNVSQGNLIQVRKKLGNCQGICFAKIMDTMPLDTTQLIASSSISKAKTTI